MKLEQSFKEYYRIVGNDPTAAAILVLAEVVQGLSAAVPAKDRGAAAPDRETPAAPSS